MRGVAFVVPTGLIGVERGHVDGLAALAGGGSGVGLPKVGLHDLGIDLGREDGGMPKQLLDVADVGPAFEHDGGAGVAQAVHGDGVGKMGAFAVAAKQAAKVGGQHAPTGGREVDEAVRPLGVG